MDDFYYLPSEDSELMLEVLKKELNVRQIDTSLEIGCGSGVLSKEIVLHSKEHIACDINPNAIKITREQISEQLIRVKESNKEDKTKKAINPNWEVIESDLFSEVPDQKFDLIVFNPPYLPEQNGEIDNYEKKALVGGKHGYEVILQFLEQMNSYLAEEGNCYLLFSILSKPKIILDKVNSYLLDYDLVGKKQIMGEELYVYRIWKTDMLKKLESHNIKNITFLAKGKRGKIFVGDKTDGRNSTLKVGIKMLGNLKAPTSIIKEIHNMKLVNKINLKPKYLFSEGNFLVYEFVEGKRIEDFTATATTEEIKEVILQSLQICRKMDLANFEKKEMTHPYKHILVNKIIHNKSVEKKTNGKKNGEKNGEKENTFNNVSNKPKIEVNFIDFERGNYRKNPGNVCQFLEYLTSSSFAHLLASKGIIFTDLRKLGEEYKHNEQVKFIYDAIVNAIIEKFE
jgi:release factor glutamine methyltransferase